MHKIKAILNNTSYKRYLNLNAAYEQERIFCRHGYQHLVDVARIAYILYLESPSTYTDLAQFEDVKQTIYGAALLHDIGRWCQYESNEDHAIAGAKLAEPILLAAGFNQGEIRLILHAIKCHRKGANSGLAMLLYQADKLSRDCGYCSALSECNKVEEMELLQKGRLY